MEEEDDEGEDEETAWPSDGKTALVDESSKSVSFGEINWDDESDVSTLLESVRGRAEASCELEDEEAREVDAEEVEADEEEENADVNEDEEEGWYFISSNELLVELVFPSSATMEDAEANILIASSGIGLWRTYPKM